MVKTRRSTDSHGIFSSEMPVRESTSVDNIDFDEGLVRETIPRRYSDGMDETVRNVRRRESRDRELRNRVVISNGSRSSTRIRDVPDRYMQPLVSRSTSKRGILLRPRSDRHMNYLRHLARNDEADTATEEDVGTDGVSDDDNIFTPEPKMRSRARRPLRSLDSPATVTFADERTPRMSNGHSSVGLDDSHEGVRRSTRERKLKYDNFNQSWILGTQNVRGYRMPQSPSQDKEDQTEEEEDSADDEPREEGEEGEKVDGEGETGEGEEGDTTNAEEIKQEQEDGNEAENQENFEDMYSRVKRPRRTRQTIMFSEVKNTRSRTRKLAGSSDDDAQSSDGGNTRGQRPQSPRRRSKYHLRQRKPKVQHFQIEEPLRRAAMSLLRSPMRRKRGRTARFNRSDSSNSSSDSEYERKKGRNRNRCLPLHFASADHLTKTSRDTVKPVAGGSLADTDPMALDPNVRFTHVGGLDEHIRCLKEMVVFPMLYPEIFEKFKVQPPKGVLFHGPPGTGKTLLARALANECSQGKRRVAFFMRKGADCLSKWVGESERQLRLLFDQAYQMRPSIIFFDELDGLAPVRSCKQDQIHASIVSTLLALMDGLKNRGDVLLIGATNRIDAIDPALRRPGRFDRELYFPLPAVKERQEILQIHMNEWEHAPPPALMSELAEMASGYCGSDLQALCTEAVIHGLRRRYPQIYESSEKLLLDTTRVTVEKCDFQRAKLGIVPAAHRVACAPSHRLAPLVQPLLQTCLTNVVNTLKISFPHANMKSAVNCKLLPAPVPHPRLLLTGCESQGHVAHVAPALLHHMEHVSIHSLELGTLFGTPGTTPEEIIVQTFREARRQVPAAVYIPEIDKWWGMVPPTVQGLVKSRLIGLEPGTALLLLATAHCQFAQLPDEVQDMFSEYRGEVFEMQNPSLQERDTFLRPVFLTKPLLPPPEPPKKVEQLEQLPVAPPPAPPKLTEDQEKQLYKKEETTLRELRIFLREICAKLARNKQFFIFVQPVDLEEAPDYLDIIKQPMDLETIMSKIDRHEYACAAEFLADINLVCNNALEYNPDRSNQGKMIRHRACYLHDTAHALIKAEMDSDFEDQCKEISHNRKKRAFVGSKLAPEFIYTAPIKPVVEKSEENDEQEKDEPCTSKTNNDSVASSLAQDEDSIARKSLSFNSSADGKHKKRRSPWARGMLPSKKRKRITDDKEGTSPGTDTGGRQTPSEEPEDENGEHSASEDVKEEVVSPTKSPDAKPMDTSSVFNSPAKEMNEEDEEGIVAMTSIIEPITNEAEAAIAEHSEELGVKVDKERLEALLSQALTITTDLPVSPLLDLHAQLCRIVHKHSTHLNRSTLPQELEAELERFDKLVSSQYK